jgi:hypothetical protein
VGGFWAPFKYVRVLPAAFGVAVAVLLAGSPAALADNGPHDVDDSSVHGASDKFSGPHEPHVGARTVPFWSGQATVNGQTFAYQMVGDDPAAQDTSTITVDVVPIDLKVAGKWYRGSDVVAPVLASPLFQSSDFSTTTHASSMTMGMGAGGALSAGNTDAQLLDATMRAQFNAVGTGYHVVLDPAAVHKAVSVEVPASVGTTIRSARGIVFADVDEEWMQQTVEGLAGSVHYLEPHRLALFLTNDVVLFVNHIPTRCCVFGAHGVTETTAEGSGSEGRQALQTYVWSSWMTAGFFSPTRAWAQQDVYGLSHELVEWAADPFMTNEVPHWFSPIAPQYGCSNLLETGDPVVTIGFSVGTNAYIDPNDPSISPTKPHGFGDGSYHGSDEALLPWFFGMSPNTTSQPTQTPSANVGRYTFLGDLNHFAFFHHPAAGC